MTRKEITTFKTHFLDTIWLRWHTHKRDLGAKVNWDPKWNASILFPWHGNGVYLFGLRARMMWMKDMISVAAVDMEEDLLGMA